MLSQWFPEQYHAPEKSLYLETQNLGWTFGSTTVVCEMLSNSLPLSGYHFIFLKNEKPGVDDLEDPFHF